MSVDILGMEKIDNARTAIVCGKAINYRYEGFFRRLVEVVSEICEKEPPLRGSDLSIEVMESSLGWNNNRLALTVTRDQRQSLIYVMISPDQGNYGCFGIAHRNAQATPRDSSQDPDVYHVRDMRMQTNDASHEEIKSLRNQRREALHSALRWKLAQHLNPDF